ncbi:MAG: glycosyltransferase family 4 protein [Flavobacteriales bacterium]|nr:glycosyltransferase family 4 protein [Flavobacteriales bacterium]
MKRALIITYYWPPAGGPGVQRWLKFVTYLKYFGVEPIVYVPKDPHYPLVDEDLLEDVPNNITVLKQPIKEPYRFAKLFSKKKTEAMSSGILPKKKQSIVERLLLYIRGNFFIPDARIGWVKPSVSFLKDYLNNEAVDVVITTGPPHSLHLIGLQLKQHLGIKWLADFRDPWTTIHYHKSLQLTGASERKHKELEKKVLNTADRITVTSPRTKEEFEQITKSPISVITNGYEEVVIGEVALDTSFSLAHIGSLLSERNPKILWEVLAELASESSDFSQDLEIVLVGAVSESIHDTISDYGLQSNCKVVGYVSHAEALQFQHRSQLLLLIEMDRPETRAIIPGKLFEYMAAKRPIIAIGPAESDVEQLLTKTRAGDYFLYNQKAELKETICRLYSTFKEGKITIDSDSVKQFSRKALTEKLATLIKQL